MKEFSPKLGLAVSESGGTFRFSANDVPRLSSRYYGYVTVSAATRAILATARRCAGDLVV